MKPIYHSIIIALCLIILILLGFILGNLAPISDITESFATKTIPESEQQIIDSCYGLDYVEGSMCLVRFVIPIFNYTVTDDIFNLDLDDLKRVGGDCKDWNDLYKRLGKGIGLYANTFSFYHNSTGHRMAVIHSEEGYCVVDQNSLVGCFEFGDGDE